MFVAERFLSNILSDYEKHPMYTDCGTWYPMTCRFLGLRHHIHSSYEKSVIERTMYYSISKIEPKKVSTITFNVEKGIAN
ncbi:hypothetical protein BH23THE1_BH23THE1_15250 [soil metagenome]